MRRFLLLFIFIQCITFPAYAGGKGSILSAGQGLNGDKNDFLSSLTVKFVMQSDCNLVLYQGNKALWSSKTNGKGAGCELIMQPDGNLVIYKNHNGIVANAVWNTHTNGKPGAHLVVQNDGNVVLYQGTKALWATNTVLPAPSGNAAVNASKHPGCSFSRTDTKCYGVVQVCKNVWACGFDSNFNPIEQSDSSYLCGACIGFPW